MKHFVILVFLSFFLLSCVSDDRTGIFVTPSGDSLFVSEGDVILFRGNRYHGAHILTRAMLDYLFFQGTVQEVAVIPCDSLNLKYDILRVVTRVPSKTAVLVAYIAMDPSAGKLRRSFYHEFRGDLSLRITFPKPDLLLLTYDNRVSYVQALVSEYAENKIIFGVMRPKTRFIDDTLTVDWGSYSSAKWVLGFRDKTVGKVTTHYYEFKPLK